jgi:peptidyl-prolyl cis-trans isomerase C
MSMSLKKENGNAIAIVLIALAVVAVGVLAFLSGKMAKDQTVQVDENAVEQTAQNEEAQEEAPQIEIKPGNPIVATVNGQDIMRADVVNYIQTLPIQARQLPLEQLFPAAQNQLVNERLALAKSKQARLDNDPEVKERLSDAKEEIVATVFMQKSVEEKLNEEKLREVYEGYVANFPEIEEVKAAHILVEKKSDANKLVNELEGGADFAALAKENSIDTATAENNGEIGYFTKQDVVPEFAEAAFAAEVGKVQYEPVKSEFGYHIIKVEDKRMRPVPTFEEAKPFLESQARQAVLNALFTTWRNESEIKLYDINGEEPVAAEAPAAPSEESEAGVEPSAGEVAAPEAAE